MQARNLKLKLIIGLGNPDSKYQNTYHNVGHLFVDYLNAKRLALSATQIKTDVYMNESGAFVKKVLKKCLPAGRQAALKPEELLVIHDDSDIYLGNYKFSFGRGAAGHHGIENIQTAIKTKGFWRLRIGIRPNKVESGKWKVERLRAGLPAVARRAKAGDFVLKKITAADKKILEDIFKKAGYNLNEMVKETL